jgi:predicted transcriptional regulator
MKNSEASQHAETFLCENQVGGKLSINHAVANEIFDTLINEGYVKYQYTKGQVRHYKLTKIGWAAVARAK